MENLVETERNEVQKLGIECDGLKKESVLAKQEYNKEHRLRMQLETLVTQLQEDSSMLVYLHAQIKRDIICLCFLLQSILSGLACPPMHP